MDARVETSGPVSPVQKVGEDPVFAILVALSVSHLINDTVQSLVPSIYPLLKTSFHLDFGQIGLITLAFQMTSSFLQPLVGFATDRRPSPFSLAVGMVFSLCGLVLLSRAPDFRSIIVAASLIGVGSSIFHPEASRIARAASGGRYGLAQSMFQVGGYSGSAIGPLLAAFIVVPQGQRSVAWFSAIALVGIVVLAASAPGTGVISRRGPSVRASRRRSRPCRDARSPGPSRSCCC